MKLNSVASTNQETGYGRMGRYLLEGLRSQGVEVNQCSSPGDEGWPVHANALWMGAPSHVAGWWEGQRTHVLTMWEATGVPPGFRENVHEIDTIIVPSEQNRELFAHWHKNVKKIPLGVDPERWHFSERQPVDAEFVFMTAGQGERKGIDIAVKAFNTVFGNFTPSADHPRPTLLVKDRYRMKEVRGDNVREISGTVSPETEVALYGTAHCFLGLARGEGWGMMPFQAMAQGCPTILADAHGYAEFAHLASLKVSCGMSKAEPFIFGDADQWWEPNFEETCEAMWEMYVNYDEYLVPAQMSAHVIARDYTWDCAAAKLIDAMGGPKALELPDITERTWHKPTIQQFWVVTDKDCSYEVNGTVHRFKKGEDYHVFGDLKRMMYENKNLDPVCLQDIHESGLTPEQLSDVDRYRSQKERCPTCGQRYNTDTTLDFEDDDAMELTPVNCGQVIDKVRSRLLSGVRQQIVTLTAPYTAGGSLMQVGGGFTGAIIPGTVLSVDLEEFYVQGVSGQGDLTLTVIPGFNGSTEASHIEGAQAIVNDRFSQFDVLQAINDDLLDLSSPDNGLGQTLFIDQTFNPTYQGYDLGSQFDSASSRVLEVSYQIAPPVRTYPLIRKGDWRVIRNANQPSVFPSGNGLIIYRSGYPGLPVHIQFLSPFSPLVNRTDDLTTVAGLPNTMYDLPALGAEILLIQPREVKRNFIESQPDPRKAQEVPPAATMQSLNQIQAQRMRRIDAEAGRIERAYPMAEGF